MKIEYRTDAKATGCSNSVIYPVSAFKEAGYFKGAEGDAFLASLGKKFKAVPVELLDNIESMNFYVYAREVK